MSTYELAFPAAEKQTSPHNARALKAAKLAVSSAKAAAKERLVTNTMEAPETLAARKEAISGAEGIAAPLFDALTRRLGGAKEIKALRAMPDGSIVALEHVKQTTLTKKGKLVEKDPNFGSWNLSSTMPDGKPGRSYQIKMQPSFTRMPSEFSYLDSKNRVHEMYDLEPEEETAAYNEMKTRLEFLAGGLKDNSLLVNKVESEQPANIYDINSLRGQPGAPRAIAKAA
jgi:hypothetical protein